MSGQAGARLARHAQPRLRRPDLGVQLVDHAGGRVADVDRLGRGRQAADGPIGHGDKPKPTCCRPDRAGQPWWPWPQHRVGRDGQPDHARHAACAKRRAWTSFPYQRPPPDRARLRVGQQQIVALQGGLADRADLGQGLVELSRGRAFQPQAHALGITIDDDHAVGRQHAGLGMNAVQRRADTEHLADGLVLGQFDAVLHVLVARGGVGQAAERGAVGCDVFQVDAARCDACRRNWRRSRRLPTAPPCPAKKYRSPTGVICPAMRISGAS